MATDKKTLRSINRAQLKFPEVEDIFHVPEPAERIEKSKEGASEDVIQSAEANLSIPSAEAAPPVVPIVQPVLKSPLLLEIESIMEENLLEIYKQMPEEVKIKFKHEGERTAGEIQSLLQNFKATARKIIDLIRKWLLLIPGINKFFLEQEAKIKADKIIAIQLSKFQKT